MQLGATQLHEWLASGPTVDPSIYHAIILSSGISLTLTVWDTLLSLDDEVDRIWLRTNRAHVKWIYLFSRWYGLLNQICIKIWQCMLATHASVPLSTCEVFFAFEAFSFQFLQLCLDAILVLRVRAIYQRHRGYVTTALAIVFFETVTSVVTQAVSVSKSTVDGMMVSQSVLLFLIFRGKVLLQPVARSSRLIAIVVRDGLLVFAVVIGLVLISCLYLVFKPVVMNIFLPWMPMVPSLLTPRMILNMQMAAELAESVPEFTTNLGAIPDGEVELSNMYRTNSRHVSIAQI